MAINKDFKMFLILFVGVMITIPLLMQIADNVNGQTTLSTGNLVNETTTLRPGAGNATSVNSLTAVALTGVIVINQTGGQVVPSTNYTVSGGTIILNTNSAYNNSKANVSAAYSFQGSNYVVDSPSRSFITLIMLISAIALLVYVIVITINNGTLGELMKRY